MESLIKFLINNGAGQIGHSKDSALLHFIGTQEILQCWHAETKLCTAGLFHAIYGTNSFEWNGSKINRQVIKKLIGEDSEYIVYCYSVSSLKSLLVLTDNYRFRKTDVLGNNLNSEVEVLDNRKLIFNLLNLHVANEVEQHERAGYPIGEHLRSVLTAKEDFLLPLASSYLKKHIVLTNN